MARQPSVQLFVKHGEGCCARRQGSEGVPCYCLQQYLFALCTEGFRRSTPQSRFDLIYSFLSVLSLEGSSQFTSRHRGTEGTGSTLPWPHGHVPEPPVYCTLWRRPSSSLPCTGCGKAPSTGQGLAQCHRDCTWVLGPRVSQQSLEPCSSLLCSPGEEAEAGGEEAGW